MSQAAANARLWTIAVLAALAACAPAGDAQPTQTRLTVFAAASLADVLQEIGRACQADTGIATRFSFAASSTLARQIEAGAPADVFVSADVEWMDYLASRGMIDLRTRSNVAGNELVLIAPATSDVELGIAPGFALGAALGRGRLAIADPAAVPAGRYAKAALVSLGAWNQVASRLVPAENARAALAVVSRGEAPLGVVYRTDARLDPGVRVVGAFPAASHPPIVYPAAALGGAAADAGVFVECLAGANARATFRKYGFTAPPL